MGAPRKARAIQLVKIQPAERLATTSELNLAPSSVTSCREAKGMGYWAATQVKGLSSEIYHRVGGRYCSLKGAGDKGRVLRGFAPSNFPTAEEEIKKSKGERGE